MPAHAGEHPGEGQVRPHAVQAVGPLALVLEQQHRIIEHRHVGGPEHAREYREVAPEEAALGHPRHVGRRALERGCGRGRLEQPEEPRVRGGGQPTELGEHRSVNADPAVRLQPQVQGGDVREADHAVCAVPAAPPS